MEEPIASASQLFQELHVLGPTKEDEPPPIPVTNSTDTVSITRSLASFRVE